MGVGMGAEIVSIFSSMSDHSLLSRIEAGRQAVMAQTEPLHAEFGKARSQWKADGTRVTPVDLAISEAITAVVLGRFPEDQFFSEELAHDGPPIQVTSRFSWVLDPIDGTNNYALGLAHCAIALALLDEGMPVYGFVYDLSRRRLIEGGPGFGVKDGDSEVRVRTAPLGGQALVGFHSPYDRSLAGQAQRLIEAYKIRALGSSTLHLAYVAAGILDGVVDHNVKLWDIAAAVPLVWAGGGETRFLNGEQFPVRAFDLRMKRICYVAGSRATCEHLIATLGV